MSNLAVGSTITIISKLETKELLLVNLKIEDQFDLMKMESRCLLMDMMERLIQV